MPGFRGGHPTDPRSHPSRKKPEPVSCHPATGYRLPSKWNIYGRAVAMNGPNPAIKHPIQMQTRVGFLKPLINAPNIEIGDYSYYDDPDGPDRFVEKCVLHHYPFIGDRLIIGKFCAI